MITKSYSDKLKDPRWQRKRLEVMERDKFTCQICGDTETSLQVHHKEYIDNKDPWDYPDDRLITYCAHCHGLVTALDKTAKDPIVYGSYFKGKSLPEECKVKAYYLENDEVLFCAFQNDKIAFGVSLVDKEQISLLQFLVKKGGLSLIE